MRRFAVTKDVFELYPDLVIGITLTRGTSNFGRSEAVISALREEERRVAKEFRDLPVSEHPAIKPWREAYRAFGAKPKDYPSSIENLVRRAGKGYQMPHINLLVDIYNAISLRYILPVGGEDLDQIRGDMLLTRASSSEPPVRLLGESE